MTEQVSGVGKSADVQQLSHRISLLQLTWFCWFVLLLLILVPERGRTLKLTTSSTHLTITDHPLFVH